MPDNQAQRDRLAMLCGWRKHDQGCNHASSSTTVGPTWSRYITLDGEVCGSWSSDMHPFQPGNLTSLAAAFPDGWKWRRYNGRWYASSDVPRCRFVKVGDTGDEYADRLSLTIAVKEAERA